MPFGVFLGNDVRLLEETSEVEVDAIRAYCASLLIHGEPIPVESSEEQSIGRLSVTLETV